MAKNENTIKDIQQLRDHALLTIEKLAAGEIDTAEAGVTGKLCESVISTVKAQLEYSRMLNEEPAIPFMGNAHSGRKVIDGKTAQPSLPDPKSSRR